jgi:hypothetical protein
MTIISNMTGLSNDQLEQVLLLHSDYAAHPDCDAASIFLHNGVSKLPAGYGTWKVTSDWNINGRAVKLTATMHDAEVIDALSSDDKETRTNAVHEVVCLCVAANVYAFEAA